MTEAVAPRGQLSLLLKVRSGGFDLLELEAEQVKLAFASAGSLAEGLELAPSLAQLLIRGAHPRRSSAWAGPQ